MPNTASTLSSRSHSRALGRAAHGMTDAALACGLLVAIAFSAAHPHLMLWPTVVALVLMIPLVRINRGATRPLVGVVYLCVGAGAVFVHTATFASQLPEMVTTPGLWIAAPKVLLVLVAGPGRSLVRGLLWTLSGYVVAELAALVALIRHGVDPLFDVLTFAVLIEAVVVSVLVFAAARRARETQPRIQRAARDEAIDDIRARMELRAAALMHDTILSHLAAVSNSRDGALDARLAQQIDRDLAILSGERWLADRTDGPDGVGAGDDTPLRAAISQSRDDGLDILTTGDFSALGWLSADASAALGMAARQCLVNVVRHSGVMRAEVAVYGSDDEISVMIIDSGKGFDQRAVGADRLGLRASVHSRIRDVGGAVQVWSTPGAGTSILLQLPVADREHAIEVLGDPVSSEPHPTGETPSVGMESRT